MSCLLSNGSSKRRPFPRNSSKTLGASSCWINFGKLPVYELIIVARQMEWAYWWGLVHVPLSWSPKGEVRSSKSQALVWGRDIFPNENQSYQNQRGMNVGTWKQQCFEDIPNSGWQPMKQKLWPPNDGWVWEVEMRTVGDISSTMLPLAYERASSHGHT